MQTYDEMHASSRILIYLYIYSLKRPDTWICNESFCCIIHVDYVIKVFRANYHYALDINKSYCLKRNLL